MLISMKHNFAHSYSSAYPWIQPIRPHLPFFPKPPLYPVEHLYLIHQVSLNPNLLCGRLCHPFTLIRSWLFCSAHFSFSILRRNCFSSHTHYLLDLNALSFLSPNFSGCKILPFFRLYHLLSFVLPSFGSSSFCHRLGLVGFLSTQIQCELKYSPHFLLSYFHGLLVPRDFYSSITFHPSPPMTTSCCLQSWQIAGQEDINFKQPFFQPFTQPHILFSKPVSPLCSESPSF